MHRADPADLKGLSHVLTKALLNLFFADAFLFLTSADWAPVVSRIFNCRLYKQHNVFGYYGASFHLVDKSRKKPLAEHETQLLAGVEVEPVSR